MKKHLFVVILLTIGCDVPGIIEVDNSSGGEVIYLMLKEQDNNIDTIKLIVPDSEKRKLILGFGTEWTDDGIKEFISDVKKFQIISPRDTLVMTQKDDIYNYFKSRQKGSSKKKLEIKIE